MRRVREINLLLPHERPKQQVRFSRLIVRCIIHKPIRARRADQRVGKPVPVHVAAARPPAELVICFPPDNRSDLILAPVRGIRQINVGVPQLQTAPEDVARAAVGAPQRVRPHRAHHQVLDPVPVEILDVRVRTEVIVPRPPPHGQQIRVHMIVLREIQQPADRVAAEQYVNLSARRLVVQPPITRHCRDHRIRIAVVVQISGVHGNSCRAVLGRRVEHCQLPVLSPVGQFPKQNRRSPQHRHNNHHPHPNRVAKLVHPNLHGPGSCLITVQAPSLAPVRFRFPLSAASG